MGVFTQAEIESSILLSIKKAIGAAPDYTPFDVDIIMHIISIKSVWMLLEALLWMDPISFGQI